MKRFLPFRFYRNQKGVWCLWIRWARVGIMSGVLYGTEWQGWYVTRRGLQRFL